MHFGATLRLLRMESGISLRALAQRVGVSGAYLSGWRTATTRRRPPIG